MDNFVHPSVAFREVLHCYKRVGISREIKHNNIFNISDNKQVIEATTDQTKQQIEKHKGPETNEDENSKENIQDKSSDSLTSKQTADETNDETQNNKNKSDISKETIKLPFAIQIEQSNFNVFSKHCESDIDRDTLYCKKCDNKFTKIIDLYEHMAEHYKWLRYACKLCNYKHYNFEKLPEHVKLVHKLKGDTDFYYSTVKAIDGAEALQLSEFPKDDPSEVSPDSRRPSRCSSDSSRLSDDSSSSSTRVEGTRKRKIKNNKTMAKKKKESVINGKCRRKIYFLVLLDCWLEGWSWYIIIENVYRSSNASTASLVPDFDTSQGRL